MLKYIVFGVLILLVLVGIFVLKMSFDKTSEELEQTFVAKGLRANVENFQGVRYLETGNSNAKTGIFFVHGAPGGIGMFAKVMQDSTLQSRVRMIAVDRLGYGNSQGGKSETSIIKQAQALAPILQQYPTQKWILYGHSFGGPVVAYMGYENPSLITHVVSAGGAVSADDERMVSLARLSNLKLLRWIASDATNVATDEKLSHQEALRAIEFIWKDYPLPLTAQHGDKDWLVPYANVNFLEKQMPPSKLRVHTMKGESHFFIEKVDKLKAVLLPLLD